MAFPTLALPCLPQPPPFLPLVPGPLPLFSRSSCQWVDISELLPTQNPLQCLLSRWGQWASWRSVEQQRDRDGTGSHKTGRCCFSSYPVLPSPHWTLWPCPLGAFLASASSTWLPWKRGLQLWSQCQGRQAQAEKRKKLLPAPTLQSLGLLPLPSEKEPGQSIHHHLPWTQPKTIQWSSKSWS